MNIVRRKNIYKKYFKKKMELEKTSLINRPLFKCNGLKYIRCIENIRR